MENQTVLPATDFQDLLMEFDQVLQDFDNGAPSQYGQHLAELKQRVLPSASDSGIEDSESGSSTSPGSSLNTSEEDLNAPSVLTPASSNSKARLGDTHELEAFIADLDQILEEM
ncbi:regulator of cell cycle RGCC [Anolis carolinensis]|uniref:regulator of cell cycle RGCC n=1 Tax=Anolis carolinensis TaxID=28377 RepID=UPI0002C897BA|nr:PREDICTED: regulator of cell cycle RGCC [Anolis carolinensis]|eukprot:XP_008119851.1 PREDICTED: regulator of cell cycle RGCC [Anolis carolinensis]